MPLHQGRSDRLAVFPLLRNDAPGFTGLLEIRPAYDALSFGKAAVWRIAEATAFDLPLILGEQVRSFHILKEVWQWLTRHIDHVLRHAFNARRNASAVPMPV